MVRSSFLIACVFLGCVAMAPSWASSVETPSESGRFNLWHDLLDVLTLTWGGVQIAFTSPTLLYVLPAAATIGGASVADDDVKALFDGNDEEDALARAGNLYAHVYFGPAQVGLYVAGTLSGDTRLSLLGKKTMAAALGTAAIIQPLKHLTRRERPDRADRRSFPSFDAGMVSSMIPSLYAEYGVLPAALTAASAAFIGFSRIYGNKHHLSDVLTSYAIGIGWGLLIETYARRQPKWMLVPLSDSPTMLGFALHVRL